MWYYLSIIIEYVFLVLILMFIGVIIIFLRFLWENMVVIGIIIFILFLD